MCKYFTFSSSSFSLKITINWAHCELSPDEEHQCLQFWEMRYFQDPNLHNLSLNACFFWFKCASSNHHFKQHWHFKIDSLHLNLNDDLQLYKSQVLLKVFLLQDEELMLTLFHLISITQYLKVFTTFFSLQVFTFHFPNSQNLQAKCKVLIQVSS